MSHDIETNGRIANPIALIDDGMGDIGTPRAATLFVGALVVAFTCGYFVGRIIADTQHNHSQAAQGYMK